MILVGILEWWVLFVDYEMKRENYVYSQVENEYLLS